MTGSDPVADREPPRPDFVPGGGLLHPLPPSSFSRRGLPKQRIEVADALHRIPDDIYLMLQMEAKEADLTVYINIVY